LKKHLPYDDIEALFFKHKIGLDEDDYEISETDSNIKMKNNK
tara:strand:- start:982 stop:1107 length:126 start_codon:yes stop_codon:yes gene_type:complete